MIAEEFRNFKNVEHFIFGRGSFGKLEEVVRKQRKDKRSALFFIDDVLKGKPLLEQVPVDAKDIVVWVDASVEPKANHVDLYTAKIKQVVPKLPCVVVGIGGGSVMDLSKAVSLMLTNPGKAHKYQGLDLIKNPGIHNIVVPTLAGTGAEVSMTAVLTGPKKKLGIKCDYTVPNQIILDPELIRDVPNPQRFYTGMDCYIHAVEALSGTCINEFGRAFGEKSLALCKEVFLENAISREEADEKLMIASYMGGLSLTYSQVGVCHALSYGLSYVLDTPHGLANCIVFNHLKEYYGTAVDDFHHMLEIHGINLPENITSDLTEDQINAMTDISYALDHMWIHAFGKHWREILDKDKIRELFRRM